jgi:hypothetical protein
MTAPELLSRQPHIPADAKLIRTFTPRETGLDFEEPAGVSLLDTHLHLYETNDDTGTNFYVHMGDAALNGVQLYSFLLATAPNERDPGVRDTVFDWKFVARPARGNYSAQRLASMHGKLGDAWNTFIENSDAYITMIQEGVGTEAKAQHVVKAYSNVDSADSYAFSQMIAKLSKGTLTDTVTAFEPVIDSDQKDMIYADARQQINERLRRSKPISADKTVSRIYSTWSTYNKARFMAKHFSHLGADEIKEVTNAWYEQATALGVPHEKVMRPAISWRREGDERRFVIGQQHVEIQGRHRVYTDGVLGALTVAYLTPEVRAGWPKHMGLPGSNYQQSMGPAQVPVLALMFEKQLLSRSPFVHALETSN